jgi:hypothetical protein
MTEMKHYATEEWIDFVNQVVPTRRQEAMQQHLDACAACAKIVALWTKVREQAAAEPSYQPAAGAVHLAKAAFAASGFAAAQQPKSTSVVELLFDSFLQPALAGARSVVIGTRQMLYRAEPYQIDIQIEPKPGTNRLQITGQLLEIGTAVLSASGVPVTLSNRRGNSLIATTNQFGEFSGELENSGDLELSIPSGGGEPIVISLRNALDRFSGGKA